MADESREGPPTLMGVPYWKGHVVGIIHDDAETEQAVAALRAAGFAAGDVSAYDPETVLRGHEAFKASQNPLQKLGAALASDEGEMVEQYLDEMREGANFIMVRTPTPDHIEQARAILTAHHAQRMHHYGEYEVTDL